ncbi:dipeptide ABC transporter ATP-binding protein [Limnochorda pilosa]|uniref:ABC transporter ATP-binding protein n=1 Tax=Limnochorda pilosa TaxID=1555112 RepID=A0A0K2SI10_LIMPI|nr:ABC transporter ATP-binding protein [Limnochorda pilosa]BAS26489.1 ABC transporter ATP-binding protein [Limnochorda pilosa]
MSGTRPHPADGPVLSLEDLSVTYRGRGGEERAVHGLSLSIGPGEAYGLVGESGCGKTTVALAVMGYLPRAGRVTGGDLTFMGRDLLRLSPRELQRLRGDRLAMVYQNPQSALNPTMTVGRQVAEVFVHHGHLRPRQAWEAAAALLRRVRIAEPHRVMHLYAHQLSGGMQQRIVIAMALAGAPDLLVLDEPTTALDATVQAEVLELFGSIREESRTSMLFISHNLAVVGQICDRVGVMYAGRLVEEGPADQVLRAPRHPYTRALLWCVPRSTTAPRAPLQAVPGEPPRPREMATGCAFAPRCPLARERCRHEEPPLLPVGAGRASRCFFWQELEASEAEAPEVEAPAAGAAEGTAAPGPSRVAVAPSPASRDEASFAPVEAPLLEVRGLHQRLGGALILRDVDLELGRGETFGLVGESGCGKSTLARSVAGLLPRTGGDLRLDGAGLAPRASQRSPETRRRIQMVFQNPDTTLNPRHRVGAMLRRAASVLGRLDRRQARDRAVELARWVQLDPSLLERLPGELSGGQRQRVAIARAFAGNPDLVILDEPTSALDVSVQAAILNLLLRLQEQWHTSYLFISHDLAVVRHLADRVGVMYLGELCEVGPAASTFEPPFHPYTEALLSAGPALPGEAARTAIRLAGTVPGVTQRPLGCPFHTRCPRKLGPICEAEPPPWQEVSPGHAIRCWIPAGDLALAQGAVPAGSPAEGSGARRA